MKMRTLNTAKTEVAMHHCMAEEATESKEGHFTKLK